MEHDLVICTMEGDSDEEDIADSGSSQSEDEEKFTNLQTCAISYETSSGELSRSSSPLVYGHDHPPKIRGISRLLELYHPTSFDDVFEAIHDYPYQFIFMTIPTTLNAYRQCRLIREKSGLFQIFHLEIELENSSKPVRLLTAKKGIKMIGQSHYVISLNTDFDGELCSVELVCNNTIGTRYTLYVSQKDQRQELAVISYESNFLGLKGPRKIEVTLSNFENQEQDDIQDYTYEDRLATSIRLHNRTPIRNEQTSSYALPFQGKNRVRMPSIKNFQIVVKNQMMEEEVVMQFGHMSKNMFSCDFRYPFSLIQAFAVGLSAFETRIFRE